MKKLSILITLFSIATMLAATVQAQTSLIPFQARLTDASNTSVPDNVYNITFKVYDAATGGTAIWNENHINVSVIGGQINVLLGSLEALSFTFEAPKYLGITIGTSPEMVPRHQLVPSFHAQSASLAHDAEKLGGKTPDWYASKEHVAQVVADATADIEALADSLFPTVTTHTSQIQDITSDIQDVSSDVISLNNEVLNIIERLDDPSAMGLYTISNSVRGCLGGIDNGMNGSLNGHSVGELLWSETSMTCTTWGVSTNGGIWVTCNATGGGDTDPNDCVGGSTSTATGVNWCTQVQTCTLEYIGKLAK